ncbi:peptide-methionine (S)-S-oxide reductase MsrA [Aquimarina agarilytica]|uniref:peptide-methionine (S)-S-oxide reductase MsrA n=1 Tax=Aquimarina agarilytica TaxID=1087449 RepID=UPI000288FE1C|nr:peptide-methionine (S)-S-oxide reductase MsrA [Aquimarina agarilytica]
MSEKAIFAGGCFWCTEAVFQRIKGVSLVRSGFSGGNIKNPAYKEVITERTGHAEVVEVTFDSTIISYQNLLEVFFGTHDPTTLNRQGGDKGTHYRSAIFYTSETQKELAENFIDVLTDQRVFASPIVTEVTRFENFYPAEDYHSNYFNLNREQGFCQVVINPKVNKLSTYFKEFLK